MLRAGTLRTALGLIRLRTTDFNQEEVLGSKALKAGHVFSLPFFGLYKPTSSLPLCRLVSGGVIYLPP